MIKKLLLICTIFIGSLFANEQVDLRNAMLYKADIDSKTAYDMQQKGALLIDVRTKKEFNESRAKDSINIPVFYAKNGQRVFNKEFLSQVYNQANKNIKREVILICRSGSRTKLASNLLAYNGFTNIYNIKNGFAYDWSKTNLPVEK